MPELPDLEVFKKNIFTRLTSKQLVSISVFNQKKVNKAQDLLRNELTELELLSINRVGKELLFEFTKNRLVSAHLMLNGEVSIVKPDDIAGIMYKIFSFNFENETVVFSDKGGLCTIRYMPIFDNIPDAFDSTFTLEYFFSIASKKPKVNIKAFLIDQNVVKGIGNAYADEILWFARISPRSQVGKIPENVMVILYNAINTVLKEAINSIKLISPDIISGEKRSFLKVHNRTRKETETGFPIIIEKIASKTTYFTEEQVVYL